MQNMSFITHQTHPCEHFLAGVCMLASLWMQNHGVTEWLRWEGTSGRVHLAQALLRQGHPERVAQHCAQTAMAEMTEMPLLRTCWLIFMST